MGPQDLPQHPVDTEADHQGPLEGLDVDVGRLFFYRLAQHGVDEADDGGVVVGVQQVFTLGQLFGQREEVHLVAEILHQLACLGGVALIVGHQQLFEGFAVHLLHREGAARHPPHFQQGLRRHALAAEQHRGPLPLGQDHPEVAGEGKRQLGQGCRHVDAIQLVCRHYLLPTNGWDPPLVCGADCVCWSCFCTSGDMVTPWPYSGSTWRLGEVR